MILAVRLVPPLTARVAKSNKHPKYLQSHYLKYLSPKKRFVYIARKSTLMALSSTRILVTSATKKAVYM